MEQGYLIDTNVISHLFSNRLPEKGKVFVQEIINANFLISVVVEIEVLTYHEIPDKMPLIEDFINLATVTGRRNSITPPAQSRNVKRYLF